MRNESSDVNQLRLNEIERIEHIQSQLENALSDLAELTHQVHPDDLPKFEKLVEPIRKSLHEFIPEYSSKFVKQSLCSFFFSTRSPFRKTKNFLNLTQFKIIDFLTSADLT